MISGVRQRPTYGSLDNRMIAFGADLVFAFMFTMPALVVWTIAAFIAAGAGVSGDLLHRLNAPFAWCAYLIAAWLYFTLQESSLLQTTFGKRIMRLEITDVAGEPITFARANARFWLRPLSVLAAGVGIVMMVSNRRRQGLHDLFTRTLVVRTDRDLGSIAGSGWFTRHRPIDSSTTRDAPRS